MDSMIGVLRTIISWCGLQYFHLAHLFHVVMWNTVFFPPPFQAVSSMMLGDIKNAKPIFWL